MAKPELSSAAYYTKITPPPLQTIANVIPEYPKCVNIIELAPAPFNCAQDAIAYAKSHGIVGVMSNADTNGKGEVSISLSSLDKMLSGSAVRKSATPALHYAALVRLRDIIRESLIAEVHPDFLKGADGRRSPANGINPTVEIVVLYVCVSTGGIPLRVKTTVKRLLDSKDPQKAYTYEISNVEVLKGTAAPVARPNDKTPTRDVGILLKDVLNVNGEFLLTTTASPASPETSAMRPRTRRTTNPSPQKC